jgi:predicted Zn-dependent protease
MTKYPRRNTRTTRLVLTAATMFLAACSLNPATGERNFTAFMSPEDERQVGREQHPKILQQFGGVYNDPKITTYVDRVGQNLAQVSELPDLDFTFTVLDDDIVNAFAVPGGFVYISRGLLGLANTEAELAGVLGHEIGHVTGRHSAQRHSQTVLAGIGTVGVSILSSVFLGTSAVGDAVGLTADVYLQGFSREHEFEADTLGVRYLSRTGYETGAMASFLSSLEAFSALEAKASGLPDPAARYNIMSTHPRTGDRVTAATRAANVQPVANPKTGSRAYLNAIDGVTFGDSAHEGYVRGQRFVHEPANFLFEVPQDFTLFNGTQQVAARGPNESLILFSGGKIPHSGSMDSYLTRVWAKNSSLTDVETIDVNGMQGATGSTRIGNRTGSFDARLVAIRHDPDNIYRFMFLTRPAQTAQLSKQLRRTTFSFRKLTAADRARYGPWRIEMRVVRNNDTVARLSRNMPMQGPKDEWFRVLNGMKPGQEPVPGQVVKVVVD